jgi:hypothetical protein
VAATTVANRFQNEGADARFQNEGADAKGSATTEILPITESQNEDTDRAGFY